MCLHGPYLEILKVTDYCCLLLIVMPIIVRAIADPAEKVTVRMTVRMAVDYGKMPQNLLN
jgi:hypothetical protein